MELFWILPNAVVHLVLVDIFYRDQWQVGEQHYSTPLHLSMLATAFRYTDKERPDSIKPSLSEYTSSSLHEKAKVLAKNETDQPGGIPTTQTFRLLTGPEFCYGSDDSG